MDSERKKSYTVKASSRIGKGKKGGRRKERRGKENSLDGEMD